MALIAKNISCERGGKRIFENLSFAVAEGELLELRGPNGSGKSSLLRLLAGLNETSDGELTFESFGGASLAESCHYIGHAEAIKLALTVEQNLAFWANFLGDGKTEEALNAFSLQPLRHDPARLLSSGQKRRLSLARLVATKRPIWLLDEPTVGLDLASSQQLTDVLKAHLAKGGIALIATHQPLEPTPQQILTMATRL